MEKGSEGRLMPLIQGSPSHLILGVFQIPCWQVQRGPPADLHLGGLWNIFGRHVNGETFLCPKKEGREKSLEISREVPLPCWAGTSICRVYSVITGYHWEEPAAGYCLWVSLLFGYSTAFDLSPAEAIKKDCSMLGESTYFVASLSLTSQEDNCIRGHLRMEMKKFSLWGETAGPIENLKLRAIFYQPNGPVCLWGHVFLLCHYTSST